MNAAIAALIALRDSLVRSSIFCDGKPEYEAAGFIYASMITAVQSAIDSLEREQQK